MMNKRIKLFLCTLAITTFAMTPTLAIASNSYRSNNVDNKTEAGQKVDDGNFDPSKGGMMPPDGNNNGMGPGGPGEMKGGSHGSDTKVESPNNTVPDGYKINSKTQADSSKGLYSKLFDTKNVQEVNVNISEDNFNYMLQNANEKPSVLASSFSIGDETVENVGIKTKGNLTLKSVWQSDSDRFSFEINTSKFVKKSDYGENQNFYGVEKICLNNIYGDPTLMKEYLSYELMTKMGIPTPYYSLVKLNINGEFYGIYTMVESLSSSIIKRTTGNTKGDLYKCEAPGGSLLYDSDKLDSLLNNDGTYKFDISTYKDKTNPLSSYTGILENKVYGTSIDDCEGKEDKVLEDANELFSWMKKLNELNDAENPNTETYKKHAESILNVDEILRYFAVNTYLVNLDHYQSQQQQNYAIYLVDGKVTVLPWDYNYSFGAFGVSGASGMINFSIDNPVVGTTLKERPLLNVLLQNDDYRKTYESYLTDCANMTSLGGTVDGVTYKKDNMSNEISKYQNLLADASKNDPTAFYKYDEFITAANDLKTLNTQRAKAVINQVNDDFTKVSDENISSSSLGGMVGGIGGQGGPGGPGGPNNMPYGIAPNRYNQNNDTDSNQPTDTNNKDTSNENNNSDNSSNDTSDSNDTIDSNDDSNKNTSNNFSEDDNNSNGDDEENNDTDGGWDTTEIGNNDDEGKDATEPEGKGEWDDGESGIVKTGDNKSIYGYITIAALAIVGMAIAVGKRHKKFRI